MRILPNHELLEYSGRIDFENAEAPVFVYAGSYVRLKFTGNSVSVTITNHRNYFSNYIGYILDGVQGKFLLAQDEAVHTYSVGQSLMGEEHELLLFKRMDACHYFTLHSIELASEEGLLPLSPKPKRRIEVFGDSVSCGEVSEAVSCVGKDDPVHDGEYSNSWYSYSWLAARRLDAELHITSQGGAALMDKTGWFCAPDFVGMESIYDKLQYNPYLGEVKPWRLDSWKPHVVIIAIGQNDANPENYMAEDYESDKAKHWRSRYRAFIEKLMQTYSGAQFILTTTILGHDVSWDRAIDDVCAEMSNPRVHHFLYEKNGCGTSGHIRVPEAAKMAEELSAFINSLGADIWNEY